MPTEGFPLKIKRGFDLRSRALLAAVVSLGGLPLLLGEPARADAQLQCTLSFSMHGWSAFYKTASGQGTVHCSNGKSMRVKLEAKGGGLTVGKSVESGHGEFSAVADVSELAGSYIAAEAQAGAIKSAQAQVMTKGEVSLALSGKGRGWDLGISFGELKIIPE
jgi:hypothetical protein